MVGGKQKRARGKMRRSGRGASLVEAIVGFIVIIPIGLAAVDIVSLIATSQTNEQAAEQAARAAACQRSDQGAQKAAQDSIDQMQPNSMMCAITIDTVTYDPAHGQVTVFTNMQVQMPIPMPFLNKVNLRASAMQPIVAFPAAM